MEIEKLPINIKKLNDPCYRYWMNSIKVKEENGCTEISNLNQIAETLNYPPEILLQFLSSQVSAKKIEPNKIKSSVESKRLQSLIYTFINEYKICSKCENPELKPNLDGKKLYNLCSSCMNITKIDSNYKTTYNAIKNYLMINKWPESKGSLVDNKENDDDLFND
tara:strand:+ start:4257 stop:4751 length:495 start_codon:yes stop_codon:yes gene_type:complete